MEVEVLTVAKVECGSQESLNETLEFHNTPSIGLRCYHLMTPKAFAFRAFAFDVLAFETISHLRHGLNKARAVGVFFDLGTQRGDGAIDAAVGDGG